MSSLILSEKIQTTEAKAKAIKPLVDKLITQAKSKSAQKHVFEFFPQKKVAQKLVDDVLPRTGSRTSGYTSTVRTGTRLGDGAMMVSMSLLLEESKASSAKREEKRANLKKEMEEVALEVKDQSFDSAKDKKSKVRKEEKAKKPAKETKAKK